MALCLGVHSVGDGSGGLRRGLRFRSLAPVIRREPVLGAELLAAIIATNRSK